MMSLHSILLAIVFVLTFSTNFAHAQNAEPVGPKLLFVHPKLTQPADPDPTVQTNEERTQTLRKRINEAVELLEKKDLRTFFSEFVDPFWIARGAAGEKVSVDELFAKRITGEPNDSAEFVDRFKSTLKSSLKHKPKFLLEGRAASFMEGHNSHTAEFWIYVDGKWRISPET